MEKNRGVLNKAIGAALIFLTLISAAVVVAKTCHDESAAAIPVVASAVHASHGDHHHAPPVTQGFANGTLLTDICVGIFYLVLLLGTRFLLKILHNSYKDKLKTLKIGLITYRRKHSFNFTLSLPQLGICRI